MYRGSEMLAVGNTSMGPEHKACLVQEGDYRLQGPREAASSQNWSSAVILWPYV